MASNRGNDFIGLEACLWIQENGYAALSVGVKQGYRYGRIYYAELNPVIGSEQGGTRPVLIISNDIGNKHSPTVIIAPITSRVHTKAKIPTHTLIKDFDGLDKNSIILFEQIRTIDKQRLREYLGTLDRRFIHCADKALAISIGLAKKD